MSTRQRLLGSILAAALAGSLFGLVPAAIATPVVSFDGAPGSGAPPATLGPYTVTPFGLDPQPQFANVVGVAGPVGTGTVGFSPALNHLRIGSGWATWSHGYTGDVYYTNGGTSAVLTMPTNTSAFRLYAEPNPFATFNIVATAQDGTTSGPVAVNGFAGAQYFGFFATGGATIATITMTSSVDFAIGEFGIATGSPEISVWLNAFIPNSAPGAAIVPAGPYAGQTMFPGPLPGNDCFLTDQRAFSSNPGASARIHAEVSFKVPSSAVTVRPHRSNATVEVDCKNGAQECRLTATPSGQFTVAASSSSATVLDVTAAASNPCFTGSPALDFNGRLQFVKLGTAVRVTFAGKVEAFPNFEMYASLNGGPPQALFRRSFTGTPLSLLGGADTVVSGTVTLAMP